MKYYVEEQLLDEQDNKNAGGKAGADIAATLDNLGYHKLTVKIDEVNRAKLNPLRRALYHYQLKKIWIDTLSCLRRNDEILIQFPLLSHTLFSSQVIKDIRKKGVRVVFLIHDLESLRWSQSETIPLKSKLRLNIEEKSVLKQGDKIIAHNDIMKSYLIKYSISEKQIISLDIFDYLIPNFDLRYRSDVINLENPIVIAGNLNKHKAGYVYNLPAKVDFNLYGIGYVETSEQNVKYYGSFLPNDLPFSLEGSFGLVWDGPSSESCIGAYGGYLKVNNPHKTSLYLASGFPVVIWDEAAMSTFVKANRCGITVANLADLEQVLQNLSEDEYKEMKKNAEQIGSRLRDGYYTKRAISEL